MANEVIIGPLVETRGRHRKYHADRASTGAERKQAIRLETNARRIENVGVIDFETDPFDNTSTEEIRPFTACIYSDNFAPIVIWELDFDAFVTQLCSELDAIQEPYTFYAHNGGKFDYMFLIHKIRGKVSFKGRGIMSAKLGKHELRDSFHIIPEKLANWKKDDFDYTKLTKAKREKHRDEIVRYMVNDCKYLLEIVKGFLNKFGMKISIGQAAMYELKKFYKVGTIGENTDATLREYFFGGRVECLAGRGHFKGDYKLFDVNSMYPAAMANYNHPTSNDYTKRTNGGIGPNTIFIELTCDNYGALVKRAENNETSAQEKSGRFLTTIWEYLAAKELDLIDNIKILSVIDCAETSDFSKFVVPLYEARQTTKSLLRSLEENSPEWNEAKKDDIFTKLLLNNAYGKFAQNPRNFKESYITGPDDPAPEGFEAAILPVFQNDEYSIWQRPAEKMRFNNVGTAASITGAARAILMRAINGAIDPIYCDTDSLICKEIKNVEIHPTKLGAWDLEAEFSEVIVNGKKLYACKPKGFTAGQEKRIKVRSKGVSGVTWDDMERMLRDDVIKYTNKGPTLTKTGKQYYMTRSVRATVPLTQAPPARKRLAS